MLGALISRNRVVSGGCSADAGAVRNPSPPATPATVRPLTISRRVVMLSPLELALELVEEAPVGALGEDLLRARRDHPRLVQAQRVEAERVRRIVFSPPPVRDLLQRLQR